MSARTERLAAGWRRSAPVLLLVLAAWFLHRFWDEARDLGRLPWRQLGEAALWASLLSLGNYGLRFLRWQMFLQHLGHRCAWRVSLPCYLSGFALTVSPGKAGELVRARYYAPFGVPASATAVGFGVERAMDLVAVLLLVMLAAVPLADGWAGAGLLVLLGGAAVFFWVRKAAPAALRAGDASPAGWREHVRRAVAEGRALLAPAVLWPGLALGVVAWGLEGVGFWLLARAAGADAYELASAVSAYALSLVAGAATFIPGGLGGTEAVLLYALHSSGLAADAALAVTVVCRLATLWLAVALGWAAIGWLALPSRRGPRGH